jgi:hypothetical protein
MSGAEERILRLDAVPHDPTCAARTSGSESMYRALEAVENVIRTVQHHLEGFVVLIAADFTGHHHRFSSRSQIAI